MGAVTADVDEAAHVVGVADKHDRHAGDVTRHLVADFGQFARVGGVVPAAAQDLLSLAVEQLPIGVPLRGQGDAGVERFQQLPPLGICHAEDVKHALLPSSERSRRATGNTRLSTVPHLDAAVG